jgi:aerobic carbon-monoxide dehydrogenase small subunit
MSQGLEFILNGRTVRTEADPATRLSDVLRDGFGLTGTKIGCSEGECGACTVLLDKKPVLSCILAVGAVRGREVTTIEGLTRTPGFAILSRAFNDAGAVQCGFCTPGMIIVAFALLRDRPDPDEDAIRQAMAGNLCRCTGYGMIVDAVRQAARERQETGGWE